MLVSNPAQEYQELDILHLLGPRGVSNGVDDCHHRLGVDCAYHHVRTFNANFQHILLAICQLPVSLLSVRVRDVYFLQVFVIFLEDGVCLDIVAEVAPEVSSIHAFSIGVDQLIEHEPNAVDCVLHYALLLIPEDGHSDYHFKELVPLKISIGRVNVLVGGDSGGD